jgi:hypothetical protein
MNVIFFSVVSSCSETLEYKVVNVKRSCDCARPAQHSKATLINFYWLCESVCLVNLLQTECGPAMNAHGSLDLINMKS